MKRILGTSINHESKAGMISLQNPKVEFIFNLLQTFFNAWAEFLYEVLFSFFIPAFMKINIMELAQQKNLV